jgi:branched-chain amino acid transport system ATP-binding protein
MLEMKVVQAGYGNIQVLHDICLTIERGEIVTLVGANGAGKSTLLMTISGIVSCRSGQIIWNGQEIHGLAPDRIVSLGVCQVPEGRRIFADLTVQENLDLGAFLRRDTVGIRQDLELVHSLFPLLAARRNQPGGTLSGGEQQMLAISRALMARPQLLLLDEPSMGLAPLMMKQIFEIIKTINREQKTTIFLVEQNAYQALHIADRGFVIENGRIVLTGRGEQLLRAPEVQKAYLGI